MMKVLCLLMSLILVFSIATSAAAQSITLTDGNALFRLRPDGTADLFADSGGPDWMSELIGWYRVDGSPTVRLPAPTTVEFIGTNRVNLFFSLESNLTLEIRSVLQDSLEPGIVTFNNDFIFGNNGGSPVPFTWFGCSNLDADGTTASDGVDLIGNTLRFTDLVTGGYVDGQGIGANFFQVTPVPDLRDQLDRGFTGDLANSGLGLEGDLIHAFQWDRVLLPGSNVTLSGSFTTTPVPEPSTLVLSLAGFGIGILMYRRRIRR